MPAQPTPREIRTGILAAILAYLAWGFLSPGGKLLLEHAGPWTINLVRTLGSLLVFVLIFGRGTTTTAIRLLRTDWRHWALGGLLGMTFVLYLMSVERLDPTVVTVLLYLAPVMIAFGAQRWLGETKDHWIWVTALVTLAGVALATIQPITGSPPTVTEAWGLLLGTISVLFWAAYTLTLKTVGASATAQQATLTSFAGSAVLFLLGAAVLEGFAFDVNPTSLGLMAVYIVLPSITSFLLYAHAVGRAGASITGVLIGIELLSTALFSSILLDEQFGPEKLAGMAIVALAVTAFLIRQYRLTRPQGKPFSANAP